VPAANIVSLPTVTTAATATCGKPVCTFNAFGPKSYVRPAEVRDRNHDRDEHDDDRSPVFTDTFSVLTIATKYTLHVVTDEHTQAIILLNGKQVLDEDDFRERREDKDGDREHPKNRQPETITVDKPVVLQLSNVIKVQVPGKPGSSVTVTIIGVDNDPPAIAAVASPAPNSFNWNNTNVLVTFTCSDSISGVASCPAPVPVSTEGANQIISGTATDRAGNSATASVTINLDRTSPTIAALGFPDPNAAGWNNSNVTVNSTCADALSGIATCPQQQLVTTEGANQTVSGSAADKAGNTSSASLSLKIDKTPPTITASIFPPPDTNGVNTTNVTVSFTCSDALSGIALCATPVIVTTAGLHQVITGQALDAAGNVASTSVTVNIVNNPLKITASIVPPPNAAGWNNTDVTVTFQCSGGVPPVNCPAQRIVTTEGAKQSITATVSDAAGQVASVSTLLNIDKTPPTIQGNATPAANAKAWNNTPVTVVFRCDDSISGIAICPDTQVVSTEGANQVVSATATDFAGNSATGKVVLNIEQTPPAITAGVSPQPNAAGWNNNDATVSFQCGPSISGGVQCPPPKIVSTEGAQQSISGIVTDDAGNSATASVSVNLDKTPPLVSVTSPVGSNVNTGQIVVQGLVSDALSGVSAVTCGGIPAVITGMTFACTATLTGGANTIPISSFDVAGNSRNVNEDLKFAVPIHVHIVSPAPLQLFAANPITVTGTVDDPNATVVVGNVVATVINGTFTASGVVLREAKNLVTATATSPAPGVGSDAVAVFLDTTPPIVHIDAPADGSITTATQIDVTGNVNDFVTGTLNGDQVSVTVNGVSANVSNRSFAAHNVLLVPGANTITALAQDRAGNTAQHQVQVVLQQNAAQQTLSIAAGNNQSAAIQTLLPQPLVIHAADAIGRPMPNTVLIFAVIKSDGLVIAGQNQGRSLTLQTDINGNASVQFRLGSRNGAGANQVSASAPGFGTPVVFSADSTVSNPVQIRTVSGEVQTGAVGASLPEPLTAIVMDAGGNPVANVAVTFKVQSGGGLIAGQTTFTQVTDADGKAFAILTLGQQEGINNNVVTASFPGMLEQAAVFTSSSVVPGPPSNTTISGVVLDDANQPIVNVTASIKGTNLSALTNPSGHFTIANVPVGDLVLFIDGSTSTESDSYPTLSFQMTTLSGIDNQLPGPIFLPALDTDNSQVAGGDQDVILTMKNVPGVAYKVFARSVTFPDGSHTGRLTLSQVHADKVPMTPPNGTSPRLVGTLQPAGVKFDPPIQMTLPNTDGLAPGQTIEIFSFHHDVEQFVTEGTGRVSDDGSVIVSDPGFGLSVSGWHGGGPPPPPKNCTAFCGCFLNETCVNGSCQGAQKSITSVTVTVDGEHKDLSYVVGVKRDAQFDMTLQTNCSDLEYQWDFGDGQQAKGKTVTHQYSQTGDFVATAFVNCKNCRSGTLQASVFIVHVRTVEFTVRMRAFIPLPVVTAPIPLTPCTFDIIPVPGEPGFVPLQRSLLLMGDGRGFSSAADASFRIQSVTVVNTEKKYSGGGLISDTPSTGLSRNFAEDAVYDGSLGPDDLDNVLHDCHLLDDQGQADTSNITGTVTRLSDDKIKVHLSGEKADPLFLIAADIEWELDLTIDNSGSQTEYKLEGSKKGFPAYEMYINDQPVSGFNSMPAPPTGSIPFVAPDAPRNVKVLDYTYQPYLILLKPLFVFGKITPISGTLP
jgi:hypothetical protein